MPGGHRSADGVTGFLAPSALPPPTTSRVRFGGLSRGAGAFAAAWLVGTAIARLTGAAAVLLLLAATLVALAAAVVSARLAIRALSVTELVVAPLTTVGAGAPMTIRLTGLGRRYDGVVTIGPVGAARAGRTSFSFDQLDEHDSVQTSLIFESPGLISELDVEVNTPGVVGIVWLRRRHTISIEPVAVAPLPAGPRSDIESATSHADGIDVTKSGPRHGDVDGVRVWREGDGGAAVHWPSTLRSGTMIVHDREPSSDQTWIVEVSAPTLGHDEVSRLAYTLLEGLRLGHRVVLRRTFPAETTDVTILTPDDARRHSAELAAPASDIPHGRPRRTWWQRSLRLQASHDSFTQIEPRSRWLTAMASLVGLAMLVGALGSGPATIALSAGGLIVGAIVSLKTSQQAKKPRWLTATIAVGTLLSLMYIAAGLGGVGGLVQALRGPMPDLLMLLLVIHGFEVIDRRTLRVHQAIGGVVIAYATGLRIDDRVGWWLIAWGLAIIAAVRTSSWQRPVAASPPLQPGRLSLIKGTGAFAAACAATLAVLLVVPVPDGPARLGLPALSNNAPSVPTAGGLAGPGGTPPAANDGTRGSLGEVGGYPGFTETMDTSVRGDLGDELVMRVRAPQPDFWRGQTFTDFDGRSWSVSPERGVPRTGPRIDVPATLGDLPRLGGGIDAEELIQTFYVEADLPNVLFAAARPDVVTFDGTVYTRPDGALRSDVTLTEGSVYTVVSQRSVVTSASLRAQGDVAEYFASFTDPGRRGVIDPFLAVPASTTQRTLDLAAELRTPGQSTYDTIAAYQSWLTLNTEYDLNAPVPAVGADAVDDYLFVSQRGFCEQIASSLAIMLRTQGVPARIATGYVPGVRDKISGIFEVRASDAHAWVEVWFPDSGWQAFDPTATVPLSGEADSGSLGADVFNVALGAVTSHPVEVGLAIALGGLCLAAIRAAIEYLRRRRRGRWGVLQDRFTALGTPAAITNPQRAAALDNEDAALLADVLDRAAFDPDWRDDPATYTQARTLVQVMEKAVR